MRRYVLFGFYSLSNQMKQKLNALNGHEITWIGGTTNENWVREEYMRCFAVCCMLCARSRDWYVDVSDDVLLQFERHIRKSKWLDSSICRTLNVLISRQFVKWQTLDWQKTSVATNHIALIPIFSLTFRCRAVKKQTSRRSTVQKHAAQIYKKK